MRGFITILNIILIAAVLPAKAQEATAGRVASEALDAETRLLIQAPPDTLTGQSDVGCAAALLHHEFPRRSEAFQEAVLDVVLRRVQTPGAWGNSVCEVIAQPEHFRFTAGTTNVPEIRDPAAWRNDVLAAQDLIARGLREASQADHYHPVGLTPDWARNMAVQGVIDGFVFLIDPNMLDRRLEASEPAVPPAAEPAVSSDTGPPVSPGTGPAVSPGAGPPVSPAIANPGPGSGDQSPAFPDNARGGEGGDRDEAPAFGPTLGYAEFNPVAPASGIPAFRSRAGIPSEDATSPEIQFRRSPEPLPGNPGNLAANEPWAPATNIPAAVPLEETITISGPRPNAATETPGGSVSPWSAAAPAWNFVKKNLPVLLLAGFLMVVFLVFLLPVLVDHFGSIDPGKARLASLKPLPPGPKFANSKPKDPRNNQFRGRSLP